MAVSAAFYGPLQVLEIVLRNAVHHELTKCYGAAWYDNPEAGLDSKGRGQIATAKADVVRGGRVPSPHRLLAAVSFGFWVPLLGSGGCIDPDGPRADYETTLWRPALRRAFPHRRHLARKQAYDPLNALRKLRNRIAHHEPIFERNLRKEYQSILEVTGWILPEARTWVERHSRVPELLAASRHARDVRF